MNAVRDEEMGIFIVQCCCQWLCRHWEKPRNKGAEQPGMYNSLRWTKWIYIINKKEMCSVHTSVCAQSFDIAFKEALNGVQRSQLQENNSWDMNNEWSETVVSDYHRHCEIGIPCEEARDVKGEPPVYHFRVGKWPLFCHDLHFEAPYQCS